MTKNKQVAVSIKDLKEKIKERKIVIGTNRVLKQLKLKKMQTVFLASNCPDKIRIDVEYYANLADTPVAKLNYNNEELGVFCKKNFLISVLGMIKE